VKKQNIKKAILIVMFSGALCGAIITTYFYSKFSKTQIKKNPEEKSVLLSSPDDPKIQNNKIVNVLLLGYGGAGHDGGLLTDSIIVLNIDTEKHLVNLISIPRDLWIALPVDWDYSLNSKINEAYSAGGNDSKYANKKPEFRGEKGRGEMAKYAAQVVVDMPINYFIAVDFTGLMKAIDLLGGIETDIPVTFDDYFYPIKGLENETCGKSPEEIVELHQKYSGFNLEKQFECRYEHIHFDKGKQLIKGEEALKFVRSRHSDQSGGDFARSVRQFVVLNAIKDKIITLEIIPKADPLFDRLVSSVRTDLGSSTIKSFINLIGNFDSYSIKQISLTEENVLKVSQGPQGQFILIPKEGINKWEGVHNFVRENIQS
jgi:anionic cell wall polymer biosynthesis LytR-Cps2A-Psr (LCP) family protein